MFSHLLEALFPARCPLCDALYQPTLIAPVCAPCHAATQWLGHPLVTEHFPNPVWDSVRSLCRFDGPVVDALHRLKYLRRTDLAPALGRLLGELAFATGPHDGVIPVPLSPRRVRRRGYNQAQLLARPVARALRVPLLVDVVRRVRETPPQVGLSAVARKDNLRSAFAVDPGRRDALRGCRCLLIDDVMTTGATLHACATALKRAGATQIHVVTVAAVT